MPSLYFFRNHLTKKVLVSPRAILEHTPHNRLLNQIGEHRPNARIRPDHWVPFMVVTGLPTQAVADELMRLVLPHVAEDGRWGPRVKLPAFPRNDAGRQAETWRWTVPEMVKQKTVLLCEALGRSDVAQMLEAPAAPPAEIPKGGTSFLRLPFATSVGDLIPTRLLETLFPRWRAVRRQRQRAETQPRIYQVPGAPQVPYAPLAVPAAAPENDGVTIHWERDEYQNIPLEKQLVWPAFVRHRRLQLVRGSWPAVDDFDLRAHRDRFSPELRARHREERLIRIGWDLDDHIRRIVPWSKKVSNRFRERVIRGMTGGARPRQIIRSVRAEVRRRERLQKAADRAGVSGEEHVQV